MWASTMSGHGGSQAMLCHKIPQSIVTPAGAPVVAKDCSESCQVSTMGNGLTCSAPPHCVCLEDGPAPRPLKEPQMPHDPLVPHSLVGLVRGPSTPQSLKAPSPALSLSLLLVSRRVQGEDMHYCSITSRIKEVSSGRQII